MSHVRQAHRVGFTLIELLVVVAIISLLISILLPSLSRARETSRMVKCLSIEKQMGNANIMYAEANNQWYVPFSTSSTGPNKGAIQGSGGGFWGAYQPFRQMLGLKIRGNTSQPGEGQRSTPGLVCPSKPANYIERGEWYRSFAYNAMGSPGYTKAKGSTVAKDKIVFKAKVVIPGTKVMGMDCANWTITSSSAADPVKYWDVRGDTQASGHVAYRHLENANMVMHDGHAETLTRGDAFPVHAVRIRLYDPYKFGPNG